MVDIKDMDEHNVNIINFILEIITYEKAMYFMFIIILTKLIKQALKFMPKKTSAMPILLE
jgi:hypothetical protein